MKEKVRIEVKNSWCKSCEICVDICPKDVFEMENFVAVVKDEESCTGCMLCELLCPDFAIVLDVPKKSKKSA